ncbi:MAG TPA: DUF2062 domain-containing protein [Rhodocyclaceae bacterium]|nr:MAG: hypothetical protein AUK49_06115 [Betaproteobacteria bacterium CG2_30_68_42]PIV71442.1 MAG: DUF2062 domain-containing protein [Rhodocyclales bacterium CG17_big_fil_post_rev_8_21_14_2_50_68_7]PIX74718.1 MAG: DUF2062 domain-containing protein [Rhodocyclales bacterium CG_4_10_14_3_um_filter_68_10]PJA56644.1 MAG: DUF2062 domain-containing protein [Rhodocyclales bacterium CG_4_9_14_3_um_filter_68_10]HCX34230.1 DUF2062 domain-containing protein [Rhodocyclaceae bacterium]
MRTLLRKFLPDHEKIRANRWLALFGNTLLHPRLWHINRHSTAGAIAVGLFCGLIPGPLQMLGAAIACIVLRVNLPLALVTTLYTNPLTIVPLYFAAYELGRLVIPASGNFIAPPDFDLANFSQWAQAILAWSGGLGKPLALGVLMLASLLAALGYFSTRMIYRWYLVRAWHHRSARRG